VVVEEEKAAGVVVAAWVPLKRWFTLHQYLYFCTSKASKHSVPAGGGLSERDPLTP
jgi:hypothetical protein